MSQLKTYTGFKFDEVTDEASVIALDAKPGDAVKHRYDNVQGLVIAIDRNDEYQITVLWSINSTSRKLDATWTVESAEDFRSASGWNLSSKDLEAALDSSIEKKT